MNFCKECNNKLYPLEEEEKLFQSCKDCGFKETYEGNIIEKKIFKNKNISILNNNNFIIYDDSLPRTVQKQCPNKNCNSNIRSNAIRILRFTSKKSISSFNSLEILVTALSGIPQGTI